MPRKPLKPCRHHGCPELTDYRFCDEHKKLYEKERRSAKERGYDNRWRKAREIF